MIGKFLILGMLLYLPIATSAQLLNADIGFDTFSICLRSSLELEGKSSQGADGFQWEIQRNGSTVVSTDSDELEFKPLKAGLYSVILKVSNHLNEVDTDSALFYVQAPPEVHAGSYDSLCKSLLGIVELDKCFPKGRNGQWFYLGLDPGIDSSLWKEHTGYFKAVDYSEGRHYLAYGFKDAKTECIGMDTTSIMIHPEPNPYATHSLNYIRGYNRVCEVDSPFMLTGNVSENGIPYTHYRWEGFGVQKRSNGYFFVPASRSAPYTIEYTVTNHFGCTGTYHEHIAVDDQPIVDFTYRVKGTKVIFTNTSRNARRYKWRFDTLDSIERVDATYHFEKPGTFDITLLSLDYQKNLGACKDALQTKQVQIWPTHINEMEEGFKVYPIPFMDELIINLPLGERAAEFSIYALSGQQVFQGVLAPGVNMLNLDHLLSGVYTMEVLVGNQVYSKKIFKN